MTTRRVALEVERRVFDTWSSVEIMRRLDEIAGSFQLDVYDAARARRAPPGAITAAAELGAGQAVTLSIDGERVLTGYIDDVRLAVGPDSLRATIVGRDRAGDLVDCAAAPDGPAEYAGLTVLEIARRICAPFGITVRADVDTGAPLPRFSIDVAETALAAIANAARQRALLVVSDGLGGLVLTRGGDRRGPAPLTLPGNVIATDCAFSWRQRFSTYRTKGQTRDAAGERRPSAPQDTAAEPLSTDPVAARPRTPEARGVVMSGLATDPEVTRYRPTVIAVRSQSAGASVQEQAAWAMRVARGRAEQLEHTVADWRAGEAGALWRPNELVAVDDPYAGIAGDMLVAAVTYTYDERGHRTQLGLTGPEAFDLIEEGERRRRRRDRAATVRGSDGVAEPLVSGGR